MYRVYRETDCEFCEGDGFTASGAECSHCGNVGTAKEFQVGASDSKPAACICPVARMKPTADETSATSYRCGHCQGPCYSPELLAREIEDLEDLARHRRMYPWSDDEFGAEPPDDPAELDELRTAEGLALSTQLDYEATKWQEVADRLIAEDDTCRSHGCEQVSPEDERKVADFLLGRLVDQGILEPIHLDASKRSLNPSPG